MVGPGLMEATKQPWPAKTETAPKPRVPPWAAPWRQQAATTSTVRVSQADGPSFLGATQPSKQVSATVPGALEGLSVAVPQGLSVLDPRLRVSES